MSEKNQNRLNAASTVLAIIALFLSPLITYVTAQAIHGQRIGTLESEVGSLRSNQDKNYELLREIVQRLSRIEARLEK